MHFASCRILNNRFALHIDIGSSIRIFNEFSCFILSAGFVTECLSAEQLFTMYSCNAGLELGLVKPYDWPVENRQYIAQAPGCKLKKSRLRPLSLASF